MFLEFFLFELKLRFKSISTYCYMALWILLTFLCVAATDFSPLGAGKILLNGPYATQLYDFQFCFFGAIVIAAIFGTSILRDFQRDTYQIIFTKPISKFAYLGGRWAGSMAATTFVFLGLPLGEILGGFAPWADHTRIAPVDLAMLAYHYAVIVVPEIFFLGTLFFLVAALTRRVIVVYLQGAALYAIYFIGLIAVQQTRSLNPFWPAVFDPIGLLLAGSVTRYWTVVERNTLWIPIKDMFLWNRGVWGSAGLLALAAVFQLFPMSAEALTARKSRKQKKELQESTAPPAPRFHNLLPRVSTNFDFSTRLRQFASLTRIHFRNIFREIPFWAITLVMIVICMVNGHFAGNRSDADVWPVTYYMLEAVEGGGILFFLIIATMYAGELVWRERDTRFEQIHDALPYPSWIDTLGKLAALGAAELFLLAVVMFCGVLSQTIAGYYNYEFLQYFKELYLVTFPQVVIFALLAFFLQTVVSNKFIAHGIVIGIFLIPPIFERIGFPDRLYLFDDIVFYQYSDMNGYGHFVQPILWSTVYRMAWAVLFGVIASLLARRGAETDLGSRLRTAKRSLPAYAVLLIVPILAIIGSGGWYYYNTHILNPFLTDQDGRKLQADYEKLYKKYERVPIPKVTAVDTQVDIFPEQRRFHATGTYNALNKSGKPISDIYITNGQRSLKSIIFDRPATITLSDAKRGFWIYHLATPLAPGDQIQVRFVCAYENPGFRNNGEEAQFVYNGTFFDAGYFPSLGYDQNRELDNPVRRREEGLGTQEELPDRGDAYGMNTDLFSPDSDFITYHTVVSTSPSQIAISPGYLAREWQQNGRRYFEYSMGSTRIQDFVSYISGNYAVKRDTWNDVKIEVYYLPSHTYDLDKMIGASKAGLDYYTRNYGPYQFGQYRIIEFPRYRGFAQSFPNTVPFSEGIGFIGRLQRPEDIDFTWFVTAHELGHQWWGHQLVGGFEKGSNMMSESLAEYSALRVMEHRYGDAHMRRFLKHELDGYLRGRAGEVRHEPPLVLVQNEPYVWYQKGSMAFYALSDAIGEDKLNLALKEFLDQWKMNGPPYPDTRALVESLRKETPSELQYMVTDLFETITLYDNKAVSAKVQETPDHKYKVTLVVDAKKLRANGEGAETQIPIHDLIEVGVFKGKKDSEEPLHTEKVWITQPRTRYEFIVNEKPTRAAIDPYSKLVDRNPEDNWADVE
ncbi:ABC transporter permease/M1 family aminopeptidase [Acidicapsa acidisoli]|uniref:ABC transporter permease/M1 family aminopeptidase n=1 Tax=Acidicapsa acidisoli TaxID=1615681 RepID=UPI0021E03BCD|nr:M1 family aminopeptidase [Acidicapsa acidisoli]